MQKHRHCQMKCPLHNSFAKSLRKYPESRNTSSTKFNSNSINRNSKSSRSSSYIKPFYAVEEDYHKRRQYVGVEKERKKDSKNHNEIESLIVSISMMDNGKDLLAKKLGKQSQNVDVVVKNKSMLELQTNVDKFSNIIDKFRQIKNKRDSQTHFKFKQIEDEAQERENKETKRLRTQENVKKEVQSQKHKQSSEISFQLNENSPLNESKRNSLPPSITKLLNYKMYKRI